MSRTVRASGGTRGDPGDFQTAEVDQGVGGTNVEWKRGVGQALMEDLPVRVVVHGDWGGPGTYGDDKVAAVTATVGPDEAGAYGVARAAALVEPLVDLVLGDVGQGQKGLQAGNIVRS